jgi:hypothetical protein
MPFFRRKITSQPPVSPAMHLTVEEALQRRAREILYALRKYRSREFEALLDAIENGYVERARQTLRELDGTVEQAYIEPVLQQLQAEVAASRSSRDEALEGNPNALRILLRSGNRQEAIEFYQKRTGVSWQAALDAIKDVERKLAEEGSASAE